ncbi:MAG: winged helix-turn-helix transcriptional regulator [Chloroflexi bacterium]|nr:winged helix-turn-helix transcriptional regulator [Chloroflexota bacterium]MBV9897025.1 winged helix-turn-helix transcriptional regulator [Chloroflexota bacterium]
MIAATDVDYAALARFRLELRAFLHFSEQAAHTAGIEPQQHQLLLALKGLPDPDSLATVGNVASWLHIQHHSAVELVDRAEARGLVRREHDAQDRRRVLVRLTQGGQALLDQLSVLHQNELQSSAPALIAALQRVLDSAK